MEKPAVVRGPAPPRRHAAAEMPTATAERPALVDLMNRLREIEAELDAEADGLGTLADWLTGPQPVLGTEAEQKPVESCLSDLERLVSRLHRLEERIHHSRLRIRAALGADI